jgi:phosphoribosylanthranilate isomerase
MVFKVCGMNDLENLKAIESFQPDYFGFIFYKKSPRVLTLDTLPYFANTKKAGVFVNEEVDFILENQKHFNLDVIQLHGNESIKDIIRLRTELPSLTRIFKAIPVSEVKDFESLEKYEEYIDVFVLDTKTNLKGGSGKKFDWQLLEHYKSDLPFLLSGGIGPDDFEAVNTIYKMQSRMLGVDINSKFEIKPGLKNVELLETFITKLNS